MKYEKYNNNPLKNKCDDCVIRAISEALQLSWEETLKKLYAEARIQKRMPTSLEVIQQILNKFIMVTPKIKKGEKRLKVEDFKDGLYLLRLANHFTIVRDNTLYDLWDCRKKAVYRYWKIISEVGE